MSDVKEHSNEHSRRYWVREHKRQWIDKDGNKQETTVRGHWVEVKHEEGTEHD